MVRLRDPGQGCWMGRALLESQAEEKQRRASIRVRCQASDWSFDGIAGSLSHDLTIAWAPLVACDVAEDTELAMPCKPARDMPLEERPVGSSEPAASRVTRICSAFRFII